MVSIGYMAMCSEMPATAPASMCCRTQKTQAHLKSHSLLETLLATGMFVSLTHTETKFRPPYCDCPGIWCDTSVVSQTCEGPAALDDTCRSMTGSMFRLPTLPFCLSLTFQRTPVPSHAGTYSKVQACKVAINDYANCAQCRCLLKTSAHGVITVTRRGE